MREANLEHEAARWQHEQQLEREAAERWEAEHPRDVSLTVIAVACMLGCLLLTGATFMAMPLLLKWGRVLVQAVWGVVAR